MNISPHAGKPADQFPLVNGPRLITAYYAETPDPSVPAERVFFGASGHRGSSLLQSLNEWHILAISQAIALYRKQQSIDGPLHLGMDTHALSEPSLRRSDSEAPAETSGHFMVGETANLNRIRQ
jgi:phosphoglucomutase